MAVIVDSYSESNQSIDYEIWANTARYQMAQSFTGDGNVLDSIALYLAKLGSPAGNMTVYIYAHTGTFGTSSLPTGSILATSDTINANTLSTSHVLTTFNFSGANRITLTNTTKYVLVIDFESGDGSNTVKVGVDSSSPTHAGNAAENDARFGGWTARSGTDLCFYVYQPGGGSASLSPSSSISPSLSPSVSLSPSASTSASISASVSASASPSPLPTHGTVLIVAKDGISALTNSDPEKNIFDSHYGTLKYLSKQAVNISFDASTGDISATGNYAHNLGYYPFCEVFVRVYTGATPSGNYEYCPFFGSGAAVAYSANFSITTTQIKVYGEISGVSTAVWHFEFLIFVYNNNLNL